MKFDFSKSTAADLQNKLQLNKLDIINKNILYITHVVDKISIIVNELKNSSNLQKQVDEYFDEDKEDIPEVENEPEHTSHL